MSQRERPTIYLSQTGIRKNRKLLTTETQLSLVSLDEAEKDLTETHLGYFATAHCSGHCSLTRVRGRWSRTPPDRWPGSVPARHRAAAQCRRRSPPWRNKPDTCRTWSLFSVFRERTSISSSMTYCSRLEPAMKKKLGHKTTRIRLNAFEVGFIAKMARQIQGKTAQNYWSNYRYTAHNLFQMPPGLCDS